MTTAPVPGITNVALVSTQMETSLKEQANKQQIKAAELWTRAMLASKVWEVISDSATISTPAIPLP